MFPWCDTDACPRLARFEIAGSRYCPACLPRAVDRVFRDINGLSRAVSSR